MSEQAILVAALATPLLGAVLVALLARPPGLRDVVHIGVAAVQTIWTAMLVNAAAHGANVRLALAQPLPNIDLAFKLEPFGALMALLMAGLGLLHAVHTAGFARATHERAPARLMAFIWLTSAAAMGAALSANLFSYFVAYQALILTSFPLVAHGGEPETQRAARSYLATLLVASLGLFLPAMVWTYASAGAFDFRAGGVIGGRIDPTSANVLLVLFSLGLAHAAIPPMHQWLAASARATHPAATSILAILVLPIGCSGLIKVAAYVFGAAALHQAAFAAHALLILVGVGMCAAALVALSRQDIRERLAYSCMAQALAAAMGALLGHPTGLFAAALQIVALSCGAATLLMAAGTVFAITGREKVADYSGLGRVMPWTFAGFAIASASMIGMPPFAGAWAKLWLIAAAADARLSWAAVLAGAAAVLTFAHLAPLAATALVGRAPTNPFKRPDGASIMLVAPVILSAAVTLWLLLSADSLARYLSPMWTPSL